jgi:hypothetical protein
VNNSSTSVVIGTFPPYSTEFSTDLSYLIFLFLPGEPRQLAHRIERREEERTSLQYSIV